MPECRLFAAYQTEIDNLTRRTKTSETVFLNVYKILAKHQTHTLYSMLLLYARHLLMSEPFTSSVGPNSEGLRGSGLRGRSTAIARRKCRAPSQEQRNYLPRGREEAGRGQVEALEQKVRPLVTLVWHESCRNLYSRWKTPSKSEWPRRRPS
jgi:hypothetical protein